MSSRLRGADDERREQARGFFMQDLFNFDDGGPRQPKCVERLFFGLFPDDGAAIRVDQLAQAFCGPNGLERTRVKAERLHLSLHHVRGSTKYAKIGRWPLYH
jgi:hypothetical protein